MPLLLAAVSALTFGISDFFGGLSARRMSAAATTAWAQVTGLVLLAALSVSVVGGQPAVADLTRGVAAGTVGGTGLVLFYWAMSRGQMSVVAPVSAVLAGLVPVVAGLASGERPEPAALAGVALALPAIVLISREPTRTEAIASAADVARADHLPVAPSWLARIGGLPLLASASSGIGFGLFFVLLASTDARSGLWPLAAARCGGVLVALLAGALLLGGLRRRDGSPPRLEAVGLAVVAGLMDSLANTAFLFAARQGLLSLVGVIGAMYPASTLVLARIVLRERLAAHQLGGLALAAASITLIVAGS